jgi:hypothetical protein
MPSEMDKRIHNVVYKHFEDLMDERIKKFKAFAHADLWFGPINGCDRCGADSNDECTCEHVYQGFENALDELKEWSSENIHKVWVDIQCEEIITSEPEASECEECKGIGTVNKVDDNPCEYCDGNGSIEPYWEDFYCYDTPDVKAIVFGKELAEYV